MNDIKAILDRVGASLDEQTAVLILGETPFTRATLTAALWRLKVLDDISDGAALSKRRYITLEIRNYDLDSEIEWIMGLILRGAFSLARTELHNLIRKLEKDE